jgi:hypothetical protein
VTSPAAPGLPWLDAIIQGWECSVLSQAFGCCDFILGSSPPRLVSWSLGNVLKGLPCYLGVGYQKYQGTQQDGEIQHPVQSLKPHRRGPSKVDSPKAWIACQSLAVRTTNSIPPEPRGEVSGEMSALGDISPPRPSPPWRQQKRPTPSAYFHLA